MIGGYYVSVRTQAVAGLFYPADPRQLAHDVQQMLSASRPRNLNPKALIAPHAGHIYSGPIAATAYATLRPVAARIRRVVLLGPTHRVAVRGLALSGALGLAYTIQQYPLVDAWLTAKFFPCCCISGWALSR